MSRPATEITIAMVEAVVFGVATGQTLRAIGQSTNLTTYYVKKLIAHPSFERLLEIKRKEIAALNGGQT